MFYRIVTLNQPQLSSLSIMVRYLIAASAREVGDKYTLNQAQGRATIPSIIADDVLLSIGPFLPLMERLAIWTFMLASGKKAGIPAVMSTEVWEQFRVVTAFSYPGSDSTRLSDEAKKWMRVVEVYQNEVATVIENAPVVAEELLQKDAEVTSQPPKTTLMN